MRGIVIVVLAYLLGSVSPSYLIVRRLQGRDVRSVGSGNAGATNVLRAAGRGAGLAVLLLDLGKGAAAVAVPQALEAPPAVVYLAAAAVVVGHVFPVYLGFRGGKGVATGVGAMLVLAPLAALGAIAVFAAVLVATRYVALGSVAGALSCAPLAWACGRLGWSEAAPPGLVVTAAGLGLLIAAKHHDNFARLRAGTEAKLGEDLAGEEG